MNEMILSFENIKDRYPEDKFILLLPTVSKHVVSQRPMYSLDVATVKIDPRVEGSTYVVSEKWDPQRRESLITEVGLSKPSLDLIASAADADVMVMRTDNMADPLMAIFTARAEMTTPGGQVRGRTASVEWDGRLMEEKLRHRAISYVDNAIASGWEGKSPIGIPWNRLEGDNIQKAIDSKFTKEWLAEREFGKRKSESKAARNAIRALLAMPGSYHPRDLDEKEFAIAKLVFTPDMTDPQVQALMIEQGQRSQRHLFGFGQAAASGGTFLPHEVATPAALPQEEPLQIEAPEFSPEPVPEAPVKMAPVVLDAWDSQETRTWIPKVTKALLDWSGDDTTRDAIQKEYEYACSAMEPKRMEYIVNYLIENGSMT